MKTISGCEKAHIKFLQVKSDAFANKMCGARLNRIQAMLAYRSIYIPSMVYSLSATNVDNDSLERIQSKATDTCLSAAGYEKTFPKAVVYGNKQFGGLGYAHLHTEKCVQQVESFITHIRANTTLGKSFITNLTWTQLVSGSSLPVLTSSHEMNYIDSNWILDVRAFLIKTKSTLNIKQTWVPTLHRENDKNLMDTLITKSISARHLRIFNNWRIYFQVIRLSDLTNAKGDKVMQKYLHYHAADTTNQKSTLQWPRQDRPNNKSFNIWKKLLQTHFSIEITGRIIGSVLGAWTNKHYQSDRTWQYYQNVHTLELYECNKNGTIRRKCIHDSRNKRRYDREGDHVSQFHPDSTIPIDVTHHGSQLQTINHRSASVLTVEEEDSSSNVSESSDQDVSDWAKRQNNWKTIILQHHTKVASQFVELIQQYDTSMYIVSDGSLKDDKGGFGAIIGTLHTILGSTKGSTPIVPGMDSSYRTEAYGMLAGLTLLEGSIASHQLNLTKMRTIYSYSDNEALVKIVNKHRRQHLTVKNYYAPDIDLELQILEALHQLEKLNILVVVQHVRGHQDKHTPYAQLSRPAQLNVHADELATSTINMPTPPYYEFETNKVSLQINGTTITSHTTQLLREAALSQKLRTYLTEKYNWSSSIPDLIWWKIHGKALKALTDSEQIQIHKFIHHRMATSQREFNYHTRTSDQCPDCQNTETHAHLIQCDHPIRQQIKENMLQELQSVSTKNKAPQAMHDAFIAGITSWMNNTPSPDIATLIPDSSRQLIRAFNEQERIGWFQVFHGRLSISWASFINHALISKDGDAAKYASAEAWGTQITLVIWRHILQLWKARNNSEHGEDKDTQALIRKRKLLESAAIIQSKPAVDNANDRTYIGTSLEQLENMAYSHLEAWIRIAKILQKIDEKKRKHTLTNGDIQNPITLLGRRGARSRPHRNSRDFGTGSIRL